MKATFALVLLFAFLSCVCCSTLAAEWIDSIPSDAAVDEDGQKRVYDFIVVGAGCSGSVVAGRLAKETNENILLLEGGIEGNGPRVFNGTDYVQSDFKTNPVTGEVSLDTPLTRYDVITWADSTRLASFALKNMWNTTASGPFYLQAKVLGGNQVTNGGSWQYPTNYDLDSWGIPGYTSAELLPYFRKSENATETGLATSPRRGNAGVVNVKYPSFLPMEQTRFMNASMRAGYTNGGDFNDGTIDRGFYFSQSTEKDGIRTSSVVGYLSGVLGVRDNLNLVLNASVTRVLFDRVNNAIGVEYLNKKGQLKKVFARKEVVLAAGTLQIPKILYNSGIGPSSILNAFGKPRRVVNEIIGQKIRNHQRAVMSFTDPSIKNANFYSFPVAAVQFATSGTGLYDRASSLLEMKNRASTPYPETIALIGQAAGQTPADSYAQAISITVSLNINLGANATLNLTSPDPLAPTRFAANTFLIEDDARKVAEGIIEIRRIMTYWNGNATEVRPGPSYATVDQLIPWIRANPGTACHYNSATPMGSDPSLPCDTRMLLRGVQKLRLIGPTVVPAPVSNGMQALAQVLGEKGTDLIKQAYNL